MLLTDKAEYQCRHRQSGNVVNQFQDISKRITNFDASLKIKVNNQTGDEDNE